MIVSTLNEAWEKVLDQPIEKALPDDAIAQLAAQKPVDKILSPAAILALPYVLKVLQQEKRTAGAFVPEALQKEIDALLARPIKVPASLVAELIKQEALEQVMSDVLYEALREFSDKVNPFFADWGFQAVLKKVMPFGFGAVKSALDGFKGEFDRRLEPEIRKFLVGFSREALKRGAQFATQHINDPSFIRFRQHLFAWLLAQPVSDLAALADPTLVADAQAVALRVAAAVLENPVLHTQASSSLSDFVKAHQGKTLRQVLEG